MKKSIITSLFMVLFATVVTAQSKQASAFSKSYELETAQEYAKAIAVIENIYSEKTYDVNLRLGWLTYMSGDFLKSQQYYKKAISSSANSVEARLGLIYPLSAMQNWNDVLQTYLDISAIDATNSTVNYQIAVIYFIRKDYEKALKYAEKVSQLYPFDYSTNVLLGKTKINLGDKMGAKNYLNTALNYSPSSTEVLGLLKTL